MFKLGTSKKQSQTYTRPGVTPQVNALKVKEGEEEHLKQAVLIEAEAG